MTTINAERITIYSMKLAGYLMLEGFILLGIADNPIEGKTFYKKFFFKYSDRLQQAIEDFKART